MGPPQLIPRVGSKKPQEINLYARYSGRRLGNDVSTLLYRFVKKKRAGVELALVMENLTIDSRHDSRHN